MKTSKILLLSTVMTFFAQAEVFSVNDVRVNGLQRITAGSFFNYLPIKRGQTINDADYPTIIRQLYQTGFFDNIRLSRDGNVLVVNVDERPIIGEIHIDGNKEIKDKNLLEGLAGFGLAPGDIFDKSKLMLIEKELMNLYYSRSKFDVIINASVKKIGGNRVSLNINVEEGISTRIKQINIIGNQAFSEDELFNRTTLTTSKWHSFLTKGDQYSGAKLQADIEEIEDFYLNRGYLNFKIESTQVTLTDDKKYVYITINLHEGLPYRIDRSVFSENELLSDTQLRKLLDYGVGEYYSRQKVRKSQKNIRDALGNLGYAFANVQIVPQLDNERNQVLLNYVINPGRKVYVRRIEFHGNYKTNDEVLRREMRQMESAVYSTAKLERSHQRMQRLQHITNVTRKEIPVQGHPDQVDVVYDVKEAPSRSITAGVGYGSSSGILYNAGFQTSNFFGSGNSFKFDFSSSDSEDNYEISFTDPYYTPDGISRTYNLYYNAQDESKLSVGDWSSDNLGAFVSYGFPIDENESISLGGGYRRTEIQTGEKVDKGISKYLTQHGDTFDEFVLNFNWTHDTRDKAVFSTEGSRTRVNAEIVTPGSTETYYKLGIRNRSYFNINENLLVSLRGDISYGDGYGDTDSLPFFRNYYAGGLTTVRGFKTSSLGPQWSNGDVKGGNFRVAGGAEIIFPWYLGEDSETVRIGAFLDFGNVYSDLDAFDTSGLRYSAGLYLLWRSPIGPLNLSYGVPLNEEKVDQIERFQFTLGVPF